MPGPVKLRFLGAAQNVTGSCYLVETPDARFIVDCGIYQERELRSRNWESFPVEPSSLDAVILTHGHLDHGGLLPKLVRDGFRGSVYSTPATADIAKIVLADAAKIQEEDAAFKRKRHAREGRPPSPTDVPLYTIADAEACFPRFREVPYGAALTLAPDITVRFFDAGHILGSAMVQADIGANGGTRRVVFSGDVGRWDAPILRNPSLFDQADYMTVESTYGNRTHGRQEDIPGKLAAVVNETWERGGKLVVPSFAVERTQELLYHLHGLVDARRVPRLRVFVDSPMAVRVTEVFQRHLDLFDEAAARLIRDGKHPCDFPGVSMCRTVDESKAVNAHEGPAIVIAGSGMCTGGRIKHHLAQNLSRPESTVLFVGYQAAGTLGRLILERTPTVRVLGQTYAVKARVAKINGFSAHADREELLRWVSAPKSPPRHVFVTHGEPDSAASFAAYVHRETAWPTSVATYKEEVALD